jgi:PAS domain S-box-containing protein
MAEKTKEQLQKELAELRQTLTKLQASEAEYRQMGERYRALFEQAADSMVLIDSETGALVDFNEQAYQTLGYTREEFAQLTLFDFEIVESLDEVARHIEKIIREGFDIFEAKHKTKTGEIRNVQVNSRVIAFGGRDYVQGIWHDITEARTAERALRESEEKYQTLVESATDFIYLIDRNYTVLSVNKAAAGLFGKDPQAIIGCSIIELFPQDVAAQFSKGLETVFETGQSHSSESRMVIGAREFLTSVSLSPVRDQEGNVIAVMGVTRDVTARKRAEEELTKYREHLEELVKQRTAELESEIAERKRAEEALAYERDLLHTLMDNLPDAIYFKDADSRFTRINKAQAERFGLSDPAQAVDKTDFDFFTAEHAQPAYDDEQEIIRSGQPLVGIEEKETWPDGWETWVSTTKLPLRDNQGHIIGTFGVSRDITKRKRAEEERERLNAELTQRNKELEQIVYVTSHDLRSPLVNVQGFSKELQHAVQDLTALLQSPDVPEHIRQKAAALVENDLQEDLRYILVSIAKMDVLLSGLLKLSRLGRAALTITTLDMNKLIMNMRNTFEFQIQEAGVHFEVSELPLCQGDATQINQVLSNLLGNALKYLDPNRPGTIKIYGYQEYEQSIYCVEDNGIGIAPEHQDKIFELFHRLNPDQSSGEGLGLTIVRRILERHGGRVWVESEPGKGSKFYVSLPGGRME